MRFRLAIVVSMVLVPLSLHADALADLRATLAQLAATTPAHGSFELNSVTNNSDEPQPFTGKVSVGFDIDNAGLRILYPKAILLQADQEARAETGNPDRPTPARSGIGRVRALELLNLLDAAAMLNVDLQNAQVVDNRMTTYQGKPARVVSLKLSPKLSQGASKHIKKIDSALSLWLGEDGVPIAAERTVSVKASFMLMSFTNDQKESWSYARAGDRLIATHHEDQQKSDGVGQHSTTRVVEDVRLER